MKICPQCNSNKIIPNVPLNDSYGNFGNNKSQAKLAVQGDPKAFIFKDESTGQLSTDICGNCGHVSLKVSDFKELYEKYQQSIKKLREGHD